MKNLIIVFACLFSFSVFGQNLLSDSLNTHHHINYNFKSPQMNFIKIEYSKLNAKQKENYNFHKVASKLVEYGYNSIRLSDDWEGADFICISSEGEEMIKVQLKGRFTIDHKYLDKGIYIAFIEDEIVKIYFHDQAVNIATENVIKSVSWKDTGLYHWNKTPLHYNKIINVL